MERQRIAVIGGGISGLSAAWLLRHDYDVTLYEKNAYIGGHTNTVDVPEDDGPLPVDTGFIVYNERNYPHLTGLFGHLGVPTQATDMSFSASVGAGRLEYAGSNLGTLFAQRRNLLRPGFLGMLADILRFNRHGRRLLAANQASRIPLGEYLDLYNYGTSFRNHYLLPMAAAIWSCPTRAMLSFPLDAFLRFFRNHGLLDLLDRPQWRTVVGGGRTYVERMLADLPDVRPGAGADQILRSGDGVWVGSADGRRERFDQVVLAGHADEMLALIDRPGFWERELLASFGYQRNRAVLHTDAGLMPRRRRVWSSWNYLAREGDRGVDGVSVTYWMNRLQNLPTDRDYFVTLNPLEEPAPASIIRDMVYHHPVFDTRAMHAQGLMHRIQGQDRLWFCGAYCGNGFHEDGLRAAVGVARSLGVTPPWDVADAPATTARPLAEPGITGEAALS